MPSGVFFLLYKAGILWILGYPDQALTADREAFSLAQELGHPFTLVGMLVRPLSSTNTVARSAHGAGTYRSLGENRH